MAEDTVNIGFRVDTRDLQQAGREMQNVARQAQDMGARANEAGGHGASGIGKMVDAMSKVGFAAFGLQQTFNLVQGAIGGLFGSNIEFEQLEAQFKVLLGSSDAAKQRMEELAKFAKDTPFELPQVVRASKVLQTFTDGALATGDGLKLVGDVAAATGAPIDELASWFGRLYDGLQSGRPVGDAMMRLQELGAVSGTTRNKIEEMQKEGADGAAVWAVFAESVGKYSGTMEEQSKTVGGAMSNINDGVNMLKRNLMQGIFEAAKPGIMAFSKWIGSDGVQGAVKSLGEAIGTFMTVTIGGIGRGFEIAADTVKGVWGLIGGYVTRGVSEVLDYLSPLSTVWERFGAGVAIVKRTIENVKEAIKGGNFGAIADLIGFGAGNIAGLFGVSSETQMKVAEGVTGIIDTVTGTIQKGLPYLKQGWEKALPIGQEVFSRMKGFYGAEFKGLGETILLFAEGEWRKAFERFFNIPLDMLAKLGISEKYLEPFRNIISGVLDEMTKLGGISIGWLQDNATVENAQSAWEGLTGAFDATVEALQPLYDLFAPLVQDILVELVDAVGPISKAFAEELGPSFEAMQPAVQNITDLFMALVPFLKIAGEVIGVVLVVAIYALLEVLKVLIPVIADGIVGAIKLMGIVFQEVAAVVASAAQIIKGVFDVIIGLLTGDWERAWNGLKGIVEGVWEGIKSAIQAGLEATVLIFGTLWKMVDDATRGKLGEIVQAIVGFFTDVVDKVTTAGVTIKDAFVTAFNAVLQFFRDVGEKISTLATSIKDGFVTAWNSIISFLTGALGTIKTTIEGYYGTLGDIGKSLISHMLDGLQAAWPTIADWFVALPGLMRDLLFAYLGLLEGIGSALINAIWNGIKSKWNDVKDWIGEHLNPLNWDVPFFSPLKRAWPEAGYMLGESFVANGVIPGLVAGEPALYSKVAKVSATAVVVAAAAVEGTFNAIMGGIAGAAPTMASAAVMNAAFGEGAGGPWGKGGKSGPTTMLVPPGWGYAYQGSTPAAVSGQGYNVGTYWTGTNVPSTQQLGQAGQWAVPNWGIFGQAMTYASALGSNFMAAMAGTQMVGANGLILQQLLGQGSENVGPTNLGQQGPGWIPQGGLMSWGVTDLLPAGSSGTVMLLPPGQTGATLLNFAPQTASTLNFAQQWPNVGATILMPPGPSGTTPIYGPGQTGVTLLPSNPSSATTVLGQLNPPTYIFRVEFVGDVGRQFQDQYAEQFGPDAQLWGVVP